MAELPTGDDFAYRADPRHRAWEQRSRLRVRYAETDQMGVVYHANYLVWCELGRTDFIRTLGRSYARLEDDGVRLAVADASLRFHASARYDDDIVVLTRLIDVRSRFLRFTYRILHEPTPPVLSALGADPPPAAAEARLLVSAETSLVALSAAGRPSSLPATVREWMANAVSGDDAA